MKIGSYFKDCDKVQKSVRCDPYAHIPFYDAATPFPRDKVEWIVCGVIITLTLIFVVAVNLI